jgi:hypothetical protein
MIKNMKTLAIALTCFVTCVLNAADRPEFYPFDVKIAGQLATAGNEAAEVFAKVAKPVSADAELEIVNAQGLVIVNLFPVNADGTVPETAPAQTKVLLIQEGGKTKLSETMDKSKLPAGLHGANIVYDGKTARVMFTVQ